MVDFHDTVAHKNYLFAQFICMKRSKKTGVDLVWRMFEKTGDINLYHLYKDLTDGE